MYSLDGKLLWRRDEQLGLRFQHIYLGGSLVASRRMPIGETVYGTIYRHTDALGSPIAATDELGNTLQTTEHEPYGKMLNRSNDNRPGYTGHMMDKATGLVYMQQRYYDPLIPRFLSVDPITAYSNPVGAFNRYWYAANNPYKYIDPDGRCEKTTGSNICGGGTGGNNVAIIQINPSSSGARQSRAHGAYGRSPRSTDPMWTRDPNLRKQTEQAWSESNPNATPVKSGQPGSEKKEQSGWVVQFSGSTKPELIRLSAGTRDQASREAVNKPSRFACDCDVLGFFHTHPNTRAEGYMPNANGYDYKFQLDIGVPGLIRSHEGYEYIPIPEKK